MIEGAHVIERVVTSGTFSLDGGTWEVDNNVWLVGDDREVLADGDMLRVADTALRVLHTPGHSPGSCCLHAPDLNVVFSGDTLFQGGPGATGRSYSDFDEIIASIRSRLLTLPTETEVRTGHSDSTTIGSEAEQVSTLAPAGHRRLSRQSDNHWGAENPGDRRKVGKSGN